MPSSYKSHFFLLWFFSFLLIGSFSTVSNASVHSNRTDGLALLAMKSMFHDLFGATNSWNNSVPLCSWTGVVCGHQHHQRVTELNFRNLSLGGNLSPFIGNLSFLRAIHLENNNFYGIIPNQISFLSRLEILAIDNNSFSDTIPNNLSASLIALSSPRNNLHGEILPVISNLLRLEQLDISRNQMSGQLPSFIGNLSSLKILNLNFNNFYGSIPYSLCQLKRLLHLRLSGNNFSDTPPSSIFNISSLIIISLGMNKFHGTLPADTGNNLPKLEAFFFSNNFTGPLPNSLCNASNLKEIDFFGNNFYGNILMDFNCFKNLSILELSLNNLGIGTSNDHNFLTSLTNCSKLEWLYLDKNQFGGMLQKFIGNFSKTISRIVLGGNHIYGSIPHDIGNLVKLEMLKLDRNQLTGTIPHAISELKMLQFLHLHDNRLSGIIPPSLGNLTSLLSLGLSLNRLEGDIPSSLGNCQQLTELYLGYNDLTGVVTPQILSITTLLRFSLSNNNLSGHFPSEFGNMKTLLDLSIANNSFTGMIPRTMGSCVSLERLDLSHNIFSGSIPSTLSSLKSLLEFDLSSNNLSGEIPEYLQSFTFLEYLNLSFNDLEGVVPTKGIFSNKTGVRLEGNKKLCGGSVEMHLPACPSERLKNSNLSHLKIIIPVIISCLILTSVLIIILSRKRLGRNRPTMSHIGDQFPMVSYAELSRATDNFSSSNVIGQGSFGSVYKGILGENRKPVAVKVINLRQRKGLRSFISECEALRNIRHRNLIKVITICSSIDAKGDDFKALVYEYMQNGSLEEWLHKDPEDRRERSNLNFIQKLNIAIDVASALEYLHHYSEPPIVHGDLKATNILLDDDMVAKVGDFGLSKFLLGGTLSTIPSAESSSVGIRGTVGYIAPEYGLGNEVSILGDAYSFGIFLLELFTGKRPTDNMFNDGFTLHDFSKMALPGKVIQISQPSMVEDITTLEGRKGGIEECLIDILRIGVRCSMESPTDRMKMTDVVAELHAIRDSFHHRGM